MLMIIIIAVYEACPWLIAMNTSNGIVQYSAMFWKICSIDDLISCLQSSQLRVFISGQLNRYPSFSAKTYYTKMNWTKKFRRALTVLARATPISPIFQLITNCLQAIKWIIRATPLPIIVTRLPSKLLRYRICRFNYACRKRAKKFR